MRLDKALALAGMSRSEARRAIQAGRVSVNRNAAKDAGKSVSDTDEICLDGQVLRLKVHVHLMMNKPSGVLTATRDEKGALTVMDLVPRGMRRAQMGPVGRLDKDVTGLVILTTDGQLAHRLISPKRGVEKRYEALAEGCVGEVEIKAFASGLDLGDFTARSALLEIAGPEGENTLCRVRVTEGKFHEVKRLFETVGHPVMRLRRLSIAGLELDGGLAEGECRELNESEEALLYRAAGMAEE